MLRSLVGSEMCIRDRYQRRVRGRWQWPWRVLREMYLWRTRKVEGNPLEYGLPYEDLYLRTQDGINLNAWLVKQRNHTKCPTLIFLHGNAGNIGDRLQNAYGLYENCLLYTSDAADEEDSVDLGGRRIIKKKKRLKI
eukprot:TRINITY_DN13873_c0_g1_i8.p1 TRINITY_DN13873_c0_g1~~TRINITY_DN13873_c0_g1_i8.p1  ORF type:complete len:137 (-),score=35.86 TRINITY_DN13873_c0_g1_i8:52-462(-)